MRICADFGGGLFFFGVGQFGRTSKSDSGDRPADEPGVTTGELCTVGLFGVEVAEVLLTRDGTGVVGVGVVNTGDHFHRALIGII